jgi:hypothetical protein
MPGCQSAALRETALGRSFCVACGLLHKLLGEIAIAIEKQFVGSLSRHGRKSAIRFCDDCDFETRVR